MKFKNLHIIAVICLSLTAHAVPREEWGAPPIAVSHANDQWILTGKKQTITLNETNLALNIQAGPATWNMVPSGTNDLHIKTNGHEFSIRLADAGSIAITNFDTGFKTGIKLTLNQWTDPASGAKVDLPLYLTVALEGHDEELVFDIAADEHAAAVRQLDWPTALDSHDIDFTVLSNWRGILLPHDYPQEYYPIRASNPDGTIQASDTSEVQANVIESWCMSWWGFERGKSAMMFIVETPNDAAYQ